MTNVCSYVFKSGKNKGLKCDNMCVDKYCTRHKKIGLKMEEKNEVMETLKKEKCKHKIKTKTGTRICRN